MPSFAQMKRRNLKLAPIAVPQDADGDVVSSSGVYKDGDITISRTGTVIDNDASTSSMQPVQRGATGAGRTARTARSHNASAVDWERVTLDDLVQLGVIGRGASGVVRKVQHKASQQLLVFKAVPFDASSDVTRKQIVTELRTLHKANNPFIVRYYNAFLAEGQVTMLMEYMDRGSLADVLKHHKALQERQVAEIARQCLCGLDYLHRQLKVVHRDIKPGNMLLNSKGEVKLSDFGVSSQLGGSTSECMSWVGTMTYMSPERIKGQPYSCASDIWSLGLTLLECALGRFPYPPPGEACQQLGFWELLDYITNEPPPQLPANRASPELHDFLALCLQKQPQERPTAEKLLQHALLRRHSQAPGLAELVKTPPKAAAEPAAA